MNYQEHIEQVINKTEPERQILLTIPKLEHGIMGVASEVGELILAINKEDTVNTKEEIGDLLWYMGLMADALEIDPFSIGLKYTPKQLRDESYVELFQIETSELVDSMKKYHQYQKAHDLTKVGVLVARLYWNLENIAYDMDIVIEECLEMNANKLLKGRYKDGYSDDAAINRDTDKEREIMEES